MVLVVSTTYQPSFNLALEEYLFSEGQGEYLLFYCNDPCVVIGSNQVWINEVDAKFCMDNGVPVLRRLSGGGAVYHDRGNINYSFITHKTTENTGTTTDFLRPVVEALSHFGVSALIGKRKDLWLHSGFKISGTASHVTMNRVLQHGTLLYDTNIKMLTGALRPNAPQSAVRGIASVPSPVKNICQYLYELSGSRYVQLKGASAFFNELITVMSQLLGVSHEYAIDAEAQQKIVALQQQRYENDSWNFKK
jgi:lipoate-protein ligase A